MFKRQKRLLFLQTLAFFGNFNDVIARIVTSFGQTSIIIFYFAIFILHSRENELYRYILDGTSALALELLFQNCLGHLSSA